MIDMTLKRISGFSNYAIDSTGVVYSYKRSSEGQPMSASVSTGYAKVSLVNDSGENVTCTIHRLVAKTFIKNPKGLTIVNHKDGNKLNNDLSNLEWVTPKGNSIHAVKTTRPAQDAARKEKKYTDLLTRLKIMNHAKTACTGNPELFQTVVNAVLEDCKAI